MPPRVDFGNDLERGSVTDAATGKLVKPIFFTRSTGGGVFYHTPKIAIGGGGCHPCYPRSPFLPPPHFNEDTIHRESVKNATVSKFLSYYKTHPADLYYKPGD